MSTQYTAEEYYDFLDEDTTEIPCTEIPTISEPFTPGGYYIFLYKSYQYPTTYTSRTYYDEFD